MIVFAPNTTHAEMRSHASTVQFSNEELRAVLALLRPDRSVIELDHRTAKFTPAPSLKFIGVPPAEKKLDLSFIAKLVDLRFDHVIAGIPEIQFGAEELRLIIPVNDNERALRSLLGSIGFKSVAVTAVFGWVELDSAHPRLELLGTEISGDITGKGVLGLKPVIKKVREFAMKTLEDAVTKLLSQEKVKEAVEKGLLTYAEFQNGDPARSIVPSSLRFFSEGDQSGIRYLVE